MLKCDISLKIFQEHLFYIWLSFMEAARYFSAHDYTKQQQETSKGLTGRKKTVSHAMEMPLDETTGIKNLKSTTSASNPGSKKVLWATTATG
jgi:hypothetical protein